MTRRHHIALTIVAAAGLASFQLPARAGDGPEPDPEAYRACRGRLSFKELERLSNNADPAMIDPCASVQSWEDLDGTAGAGEASDLSGMLDSLGQGGATIAQFQCEFVGHVMMGLPAAMNRRQPQVTLVALTILESGAVMINGTTIQPSRTKPAEMNASATLESALYDVRSVMRAVAGSGSSPPVFGLTPDENRQLNMGLGLALTLTEQMMGDRERYMVVMLPTNTVGFFDAGPGGQALNGGTTPCIRTM